MSVASSICSSAINGLIESARESAGMAPGACDMVHYVPIRTAEAQHIRAGSSVSISPWAQGTSCAAT